MPRLSRLAFAFLLTAVLASTSALAAGPRPGPVMGLRASDATHAVARLWSLLASLWSKNGCEVDPHGNCLPGTGSATATAKNGCEVDPSGLCRR
jgi:hypothetical protein